MNPQIKYYLAIFLRRLPLFAIVVAFFSAIAIAAAIMLPTVYRAEATLLVESPQIPDDLATSTVQTNPLELLEIIEQRLQTRSNLIDIANDYQVFPDRATLSPDQVVERMRNATIIRRSSGRDSATLLNIAFEAERATTAADVVNEYVTRVLDDNVRQRTARAEQTLDFFRQEVTRLSQELDNASSAILEFKNSHLDALPDSLDYRLNRQAALQERLIQANRDITTLQDQRARLIQIFEATGRLGGGSNVQLSPEQQELADLKSQLDQALTVYSETNPRVTQLKARIAALESSLAAGTPASGAASANGQADGQTAMLDLQLSEIDSRVSMASDEVERLKTELARLEDSIERTPANAVQLEALQRQYDNAQQLYNNALAGLSAAQTGERIELLSKGERISVLSQATVPDAPVRPNRPLIAIGGVAGSIALALGLVVLLELLNRRIRRPVDLTKGLGIVPLVTIPYVRTRAETLRRRMSFAAVMVAIVAGVPAALYYVHVEYLPLDLIFDRFVTRLGL